MYEADENFILNLSNPSSASISDSQGIGTILDNDSMPYLSIDSPSVSEATGSLTFTVSLSAASGQTITVNYATADGTAVSTGDYTTTSGTLTFNPGTTSQTIIVSIQNDTTLESNEIFSLNLSGPINANFSTSSGTGTILNDDLGVSSVSTLDADGNGKIDHLKIVFTEAVNDSSFPGYSLNGPGSVQTQWSIAGYNNLILVHGTAISFETDTVNDAILYLKFDEGSLPDTGAKPDLTTTASPVLTALSSNALGQINTATIIEADGAKPIIINAESHVTSTELIVTFSEAVFPMTGAPTCGSGGDISQVDLTYTDSSASGASSLTGMGSDVCASDAGNNAIFIVDAGFIGTDSVNTIAAQSIYDASDNAMNADAKYLTIIKTSLHYAINGAGGDTIVTVQDQSGFGANGTVNGAIFATDPAGKTGQAYQFDGVDDYISTTSNANITFNTNDNFTIAFWADIACKQPNTSSNANVIIEKWSGSGPSPYLIVFNNQTHGDRGKVMVARYDGTNNPNITSSQSICDTGFKHIIFIRNGASLYLYINGKQDATVTDTTSASTSEAGSLYIGKSPSSRGPLKGKLDDIRIYNYALSEAEIKLVSAKVPDGLVAYFPLQPGLDTTNSATIDAGDNNPGNMTIGSTTGTDGNDPSMNTDRFGNTNFAYLFDGTDDYMHNSSSNVNLSNNSMTFATWIKRSGPSSGIARIITFLGTSGIPNQGLHWGFLGDDRIFCTFWNNDLVSTNTLIDTDWHHIAFSYDYSKCRLSEWFLIGCAHLQPGLINR
ncbi:MAG: hypothetical protein H7A25_13655 [Leptospiraceae bacterium]|nr:hypothetical protein [Leptospiraceae bacterium]